MTNTTRADGDDWDITTSVGFTALLVAAARAVENTRPDALAQDPHAPLFIEAAGDPRTLEMVKAADAAGNPLSASRHLGVRTKFFDDFVRDAVGAGVRQVVILAAGLDSRAYRLDLPADTVVYELDRAPVLQFKTETLAAHGVHPATGHRPVPVDLRENWPAALRDAGFAADEPSAWTVEGLLPYLPAAAQKLLFERIVALAASGSRVAVEGLAGDLDVTGFRSMLEQYSTPDDPLGDFDVASLFVSDGDRTDPADDLGRLGWTIHRLGSPIDASRHYGLEIGEVPAGVAALSESIQYFTAESPLPD